MTGAVILAAGYSSRMGAFKPLLDVGGEPALARVIHSAAAADETAVITGFRRGELEELIRREGATEIYNSDYDKGMFSSVRAGVKYFADKSADGIVLLPCDCPAVPPQAARTLIELAADRFAVPVYRGKKGHPLWIPASMFGEILAHDGTMGLKGVTLAHDEEMLRIDMPYEGVVLDMDEPRDYEKILSFASVPPLSELAAGRRFVLMRHGETAPHAGKIFVGWYDTPLSPRGVEQAHEGAERLRGMGLNPRAVYCGTLTRAVTAARIAAQALSVPVEQQPELNEICLGAWDGQLIDDIKKEYPAEYERRGRQLMTYKFDDRAESFYDLQYRVVSCLREILTRDKNRDIVIVSHAGVMKCLYGNLTGHDVEWAFDRFWPQKGEIIELSVKK